MDSVNKRGRKVKVVDFKKPSEPLSMDTMGLDEIKILHLPITLDKLTHRAARTDQPETREPITSYIETDGSRRVYDSLPLPTILDYENVRKIEVKRTDVACWWCCHTFDSYPVSAPLQYNADKDYFNVVGVFCSFNCAKSYSFSLPRPYRSYESFLYKRIMGKFKTISMAPPKSVLKMFGGPLSIEEYRSAFDKVTNIKLNVYPMVYIPRQVEVTKPKAPADEMYRGVARKGVTDNQVKSATKRLTAKKPAHPKGSLLDMMGITVK